MPSVDRGGALSLGRSTTPVVAGHDSAHELIEQRHGKCRIPVIWTPNHPLGNELIARRTQRSDVALQTGRNVARAMRAGTKLSHRAQILLFCWSKSIEANSK